MEEKNSNYYSNQKKFKNKNKNKQKNVKYLNEENPRIDLSKEFEEIQEKLEIKGEEIIRNISSKVNDQIEINVARRMKEEEKRILKRKNGKIIRRDIFIILLLAIIGYLVYVLYSNNYIDFKFINKPNVNISNTDPNAVVNENVPQKDEDEKSTEYINEYKYLVENMQLTGKDASLIYQNDSDNASLSQEIKMKIAYKNMDKDKIKNEDDTLIFESKELHNSYKNIFGNKEDFKDKNFNYNNHKFIYINNMYVSSIENNEELRFGIVYNIEKATMNGDTLSFIVSAGRFEDNKIMNINTEEVLKEEYDGDISSIEDTLPKYSYTYKKQGDKYYFDSIKLLSNRES